MKNDNKAFTTTILHYVIYAVLVVFIWNLPPADPLTELGMKTLGVFVGLLYGLIFIKQYAVPCFTTIVLMGLSGAYPSMNDCMCEAFGNVTFAMIFTVLMISAMLQYTGAIAIVARKLINAKFATGRPWVLTGLILLVTFVIAMFNDSMVVVPIMLTLVMEIFRGCGQQGNRWTVMVMTSILGVSLVASNTMPFCPGPAIAYGVFTGFIPNGHPSNGYAGAYILTNGMIALTMTALFFVVIYLCCRNRVDAVKNYVPSAEKYEFNFEQKVSLGIFAFYVLIQLVPYILPAGSALGGFLNFPGVTGWASTAVVLICLVTKRNGEPIIRFEDISSRLGWFALLMMAAIGTIIAPMQSDATGVMTWMGNLMKPVVTSIGGFGSFAVILAFCMIFTNLTDNIAVFFMAIPVLYVCCVETGLNPVACMAPAIPAIQMGICLPASTPYSALLYGMDDTGFVKKTHIMGWGALYCVIGLACMVMIGWMNQGLFPVIV